MNRAMRRALNAMSKDREQIITAVHEAGHAVGRYAVAAERGYTPEQAIFFVEMGPGAGGVEDSIGYTAGAMLTHALDEWLNIGADDHFSYADLAGKFAFAREEGLDVDLCVDCQILVIVSGPAAEARFTERPIDHVMHNGAGYADLLDAQRVLELFGHSNEEQRLQQFRKAANRAVSLMNDERYWRAVTKLADRLPIVGRVEGHQVAAIIRNAVGEPP
jgi:hypothetical protein